jgi:hypothetical protein
MSYIGNSLQTGQPNYKIIDDISGSFNGVTTSFPLLVGGLVPAPFPVSSQHCLISVGGVLQEPDPTGSAGYLLSGNNIVFSAAPNSGQSFFGTVLAGADYINVGGSFPDGTVSQPSITFDSDLNTGIFRSGADQLSITTSGATRTTVDSAGRLGIGTESPSMLLDVKGTVTAGGGSDEDLQQWNIGSDNVKSEIKYVDTAALRGMRFGTSTAHALGLQSSNTERIRLDYDGVNYIQNSSAASQLRIGTLDKISFEDREHTLTVYGHSTDDYTLLRGCNVKDGTPVFDAYVNGTRSIEIESDGGVNSQGPYTNVSDQRLKENIVDSPSQWDDVKALRVRKFNFTEASGYPMNPKIGFIAQEVEQVSPGLVKTRYSYDEDGQQIVDSDMKLVKTTVITTKGFKALQEAMARIETLETQNASQAATITAFEARLTALEGGAS